MPKCKIKQSSGFTLIELLIVISIISILSIVGLSSFQGVRNNALKAKRLADLNAIRKAYEANYDPSANNGQGGYKALSTSNFANNTIPTPDNPSNPSYIITGPTGTSTGPNYAACINTSDGTTCTSSSQTNCSCVNSTQGTPFTNPVTGGSNPSCDPYGILSTGLIAYWKMDNSWNDYSINGNTIVPTGGPVFATPGKFGYSLDQAASLNSTQYLRVTTTSNNFNFDNIPFTLSAWIKLNADVSASTQQGIFGKDGRNDVGFIRGYRLELFTNSDSSSKNKLQFNFSLTGAGYQPSITTTQSVSFGSWHLITLVFIPNTSVAMYIDGAMDPLAPVSITGFPHPNAQAFDIGNSNTGDRLNGLMDDVRVYSRALSTTEVNTLYNSNTGCPL